MGVDVYLHLFNLKSYQKEILPAYRTFLQKNDPRPAVALLRECSRILQANPKIAEEMLWNRKLVEEAIGIITGTVYYSPDGGRTSNQGKTQKALKVRQRYAKSVFSEILSVLCIPRDKGINPKQDMTNTPLIHYLYEHSEWLEELFTFSRTVKGGSLELPMYESSELFTKKELREFRDHLAKVPPPGEDEIKRRNDQQKESLRNLLKQMYREGSPEFKERYEAALALQPNVGAQLKEELDNLRRLVKIALEDPDLTLVLSVSI